jgi:hypothetical protein
MDKLIEYLKKFKELYILASFLITIKTSLFLWGWHIESNQMHILKSVVYEFENNQKCGTNRFEYDEYLINYMSLKKLKERHSFGGSKIADLPVKRKEKCEK